MYTEYVSGYSNAMNLINTYQQKCPRFASIMYRIHVSLQPLFVSGLSASSENVHHGYWVHPDFNVDNAANELISAIVFRIVCAWYVINAKIS